MDHVVFVVPYAMDTTLRFVRAVAGLPDIRLAIISQQPAAQLSPALAGRMAAYERVSDPLDVEQLTKAVRARSRGAWAGASTA